MGLLGEILIRIYHEPAGRAQYLLRAAPRRRGNATAKAAPEPHS
jgi:hypothetical protein